MRQLDIGEIQEIKDKLIEEAFVNDAAPIFYSDIDEALVGIGVRFGTMRVALYSIQHCLKIYMSWDMAYEDAMEHFNYNVIGGWVGDYTPMFVDFEVFE